MYISSSYSACTGKRRGRPPKNPKKRKSDEAASGINCSSTVNSKTHSSVDMFSIESRYVRTTSKRGRLNIGNSSYELVVDKCVQITPPLPVASNDSSNYPINDKGNSHTNPPQAKPASSNDANEELENESSLLPTDLMGFRFSKSVGSSDIYSTTPV